MPYLQLKSIHKRFKITTVLNDICIDFQQGEFITILGPSGCGKTTLLHIIAGVLSADSGEVLFDGRDITHIATEKRNFGVVFQNYALFPNLTVAENIAYGLSKRHWKGDSRWHRIDELLELIGLRSLDKSYPHELSGGQKQRVAFARALAPKPSLLLLDEPLSALDAQVRANLGQEILRIQRDTKITTIMVTHDQQDALALADRVILMNQGAIEQIGSPNELYYQPSSQFVAEFIGHMNIVTFPYINHSQSFGIRYEDVIVNTPSEIVLQQPFTWVGKVINNSLMGAFQRVRILLNDFSTYLYADIPNPLFCEDFNENKLVAITLPKKCWHKW